MLVCPAINKYTDAQTYSTDLRHYPLGSVAFLDAYWTDAGSVKHKAKIGLVLLRCLAAISGTGIPVSLSYNVTYGRGATGTYAAADLTKFFGITIAATSYAAGDLAWFQFSGPSYVIVAGTGAISSLGNVQHNTAGTSVKAATDFDNAFATLNGVAMGGDGNIPAGDLWFTNKCGFGAH